MRSVRPLVMALCALALSAVHLHAADWQIAETRHFQFIFEPRDRRYVDELLTFSEEVARLCNRRRVPYLPGCATATDP